MNIIFPAAATEEINVPFAFGGHLIPVLQGTFIQTDDPSTQRYRINPLLLKRIPFLLDAEAIKIY